MDTEGTVIRSTFVHLTRCSQHSMNIMNIYVPYLPLLQKKLLGRDMGKFEVWRVSAAHLCVMGGLDR